MGSKTWSPPVKSRYQIIFSSLDLERLGRSLAILLGITVRVRSAHGPVTGVIEASPATKPATTVMTG